MNLILANLTECSLCVKTALSSLNMTVVMLPTLVKIRLMVALNVYILYRCTLYICMHNTWGLHGYVVGYAIIGYTVYTADWLVIYVYMLWMYYTYRSIVQLIYMHALFYKKVVACILPP